MAKPDRNGDEIRKKRWLRALQLAKLLFEEEGYFTDYLIETEELVKDTYQGRSGLAVQTRMHWSFAKPSKGSRPAKPLSVEILELGSQKATHEFIIEPDTC